MFKIFNVKTMHMHLHNVYKIFKNLEYIYFKL